jgi:prepilin-type N-terminal cleavage/methylation domain-containing protein
LDFGLRKAFTLIELLVVIVIIGILAAMLLSAIAIAKRAARISQTKSEMALILNAIHSYDFDYNRMPASPNAITAAVGAADFTYGTFNLPDIRTPNGPSQPVHAVDASGADLVYQTNNAELMNILLDLDYYPNLGHSRNTRQKNYLPATMNSDTNLPGVGPDHVYRDPFKNPYIITLDLNNDERTRDSFYRRRLVSEVPGSNPGRGINGLIPIDVNSATVYEVNAPVIVWTAGPDGMIDTASPANKGANKDNIISWGQ